MDTSEQCVPLVVVVLLSETSGFVLRRVQPSVVNTW
jgi:hypothetical protein